MANHDLWTAAGIAHRLAISIEQVGRLCARADFPRPVQSVPYFDLWRASDVEAWLLEGRPDS